MSNTKNVIFTSDAVSTGRDLLKNNFGTPAYKVPNTIALQNNNLVVVNQQEFSFYVSKDAPKTFLDSLDSQVLVSKEFVEAIENPNGFEATPQILNEFNNFFNYGNIEYQIPKENISNTANQASSTEEFSINLEISDLVLKSRYDTKLISKGVVQETRIKNFYRYFNNVMNMSATDGFRELLKKDTNDFIEKDTENVLESNPEPAILASQVRKNNIIYISEQFLKDFKTYNAAAVDLPYYNKLIIPLNIIRPNNVNISNDFLKIKAISRMNLNLLFAKYNYTTPTVFNFEKKDEDGNLETIQPSSLALTNLSLNLSKIFSNSGLPRPISERRNFFIDNLMNYFSPLNPLSETFVNTPPVLDIQNNNSVESNSQIFKNTPTTLNPVYIKISKFAQNDVSPLQEIYIGLTENYQTLGSLEYIDSQILPNKQYRYSVSIGCIINTVNYKYTKEDSGNDFFRYKQYTIPLTYVLDLPYFDGFVNSLDIAPMIPDISFITQIKESNKIKLLINKNSAIQKPIVVFPATKSYFDKVVPSDSFGNISFFDDVFDFYEVYILEKEPLKISDFAEASGYRINVLQPILNFNFSINKIYYITAFSKKQTGEISNPSPVYKIEFKATAGAVIPIISVQEIKTDQELLEKFILKEKNTRKSIRISPSFFQTIVSEIKGIEKTYRFSDLGVSNEGGPIASIWQNPSDLTDNENKLKFKLRITSKNSGKKVDINLNFIQNIIKKR